MSFLPSLSSKVRVLSALLALCVLPSSAQDADLFLTSDLNARGVIAPYPLSDFLRAGDSAVFVKERRPAELWVTDGTDQGTRRLPAECDPCRRLELVGGDGSRVYFFGNPSPGAPGTPSEPSVFGVTDGTPSGTRTLLNPTTGFVSTFPSPKAVGDKLFLAVRFAGSRFPGSPSPDEFETWVTDGTPDGTFPLFDERSERRGPSFGPALGGDLVFTARSRLWRSDGTREGTVLLSDPESIDPSGPPVRLGARALFLAENVASGDNELWRTDGTLTGTRLVTQIPRQVNILLTPTVVGDLVFFKAEPAGGDLVWRSDGTPEGTFQVARLEGRTVTLLGAAGDTLLFFGHDSSEDETRVWRSDGTVDGTFPLELGCEPSCSPRLPQVELGDRFFFGLQHPTLGVETWESDGTSEGTQPVADLCPGPCSSDPRLVVEAPDALYVAAGDPIQGPELYRFEAGAAPRRLTSFQSMRPFAQQGVTEVVDRPAQGVVLSRGALFTAADRGTDLSLYLTRGTEDSTHRAVELDPALNSGSAPSDLARVGEDVVFLATDGVLPRRTWRANGFPGGTVPLDVLPLRPEDGGPSEPFSLLPYRSGFVVWAQRPNDRYDLWRWTPDGAERLAENLRHTVLPNQFPPPPLVVAQERIFFVTQEDPDGTARLWVSDGTPDGTRGVREFDQIVDRRRLGASLVAFGDRAAFTAIERDGPRNGVWASDGTDEGTLLVFQRPPFSQVGQFVSAEERAFFSVSLPQTDREPLFAVERGAGGGNRLQEVESDGAILFSVGSRLFFAVSGEEDSPARELWVSDGTGTRFLTELDSLPTSASPAAVLGNTVHLLTGSLGDMEPARILATDGTPAGTTERDLLPTTVRPTGLAAAGNLLVIETTDQAEKRLWVSEGGTEPAQPLSPVFTEIDLTELSSLGTVAVFPADDGTTGREPWTLTTGPLPSCKPGPQTLCVTEDRLRVEVSWRDPRSGDMGRGFVVPGTQLADSGFFWFFDEDNVELVVKVLDARPVNGHFWVFSGSLTDVERTITVTDTQTGAVQTYHREAGNSTGQIDVMAF